MDEKNFKYIYGPVPSWRLGSSLGIDPISQKEKICSFNCVYCQLGDTNVLTDKRQVFIPAAEIIKEINMLPPLEIDYITFSGRGEPTLAKNLGEMIREVKKVRKEKIAVITNSSLFESKDVQEDLLLADFVVAKLDVSSQYVFKIINRPICGLKFKNIIKAIKNFRSNYKGRLALQSMFIDENKKYVSGIAEIAKTINPSEVQINTPLRTSKVKPLSKSELADIEKYFCGLNVVNVYKVEKKMIKSISDNDTLKRRGKV